MHYNHEIDNIILKELRKGKDEDQYYLTSFLKIVAKKYPTASKKTVLGHLNTMASPENDLIEENMDIRGIHNEKYYRLSNKAKMDQKLFGCFEPVKSHREPRISHRKGLNDEEREIHKNEYYRLRNLYRLLFFSSIINRESEKISEEGLDKMLSSVGKSKDDLIVDRTNQLEYSKEIVYKPLECVRITKCEAYSKDLKHQIENFYWCRQLSLSYEEIRNILESIKKNRRNQFRDLYVPFIDDLSFSEEEFVKAINFLAERKLIGSISLNILSSKKQVRYFINDDKLQDLIDGIWDIHTWELRLLEAKTVELELPSKKEERWLIQVYGKDKARIILTRGNLTRKTTKWKRNKEDIQSIKKILESWNKRIDGLVIDLNRKYGKHLREYDFPSSLIEDVCYRKILAY